MAAIRPSFAEALRVWVKVGLLSFGGPAGQIATMHRIVVEEKKWVGEDRFLRALNVCMLLPGPEAQQLATYLGWMLHRVGGGVVAGTLFVLPGAVVMLALAAAYVGLRHVPAVEGLMFGLKPAVLAVVVEATLRIGRRALRHRLLVVVAVVAFVAIFLFRLPFPLIIAAAGLLGLVAARAGHPAFAPPTEAEADGVVLSPRPSPLRTLRTALVCIVLWLAPVALALAVGRGAYGAIGLFFCKMAVVSFGGAYAVLAYVAQQAVAAHHWLGPGEMLDGLGLAETTPGPLILVNQFVGFLAGYRQPGGLPPWLGGTVGALLTLWATFMPSFLWIFVGAPHIERLRRHPGLSGALTAITAAVVGVILNLAVWFALHVLFVRVSEPSFGPLRLVVPDPLSLDLPSLALAAMSMLAMLRMRVGMIATLGAAATTGLAWRLLLGG